MNENQSSQEKFLGGLYKSLECIKTLVSNIAVESMDIEEHAGGELHVIELAITGLQDEVINRDQDLRREIKKHVK